MSNLLPLTPEGVADQALQAEADRLHSSGELAVNAWTANARPASGWNLQGFMEYRRQAAASVPQFPGAQVSTGWLDTAKKFVPEHEGNESFAYHGILSAPRKAGQKYVKAGHGSKEEVSVGYGFNLQRRDARNVFKQQLGLSDTDFDDVYNGRRGVSPAESEKLLTYALYEANAQIDHKLRGVPLRDHQRAALVSLVYNAGIGSVEGSGLLEAVRHGNEGEAAGRILAFNTMGGALDGRRKSEASLFLGARAEEYFNWRAEAAKRLARANTPDELTKPGQAENATLNRLFREIGGAIRGEQSSRTLIRAEMHRQYAGGPPVKPLDMSLTLEEHDGRYAAAVKRDPSLREPAARDAWIRDEVARKRPGREFHLERPATR